jgi:hypothetical protein
MFHFNERPLKKVLSIPSSFATCIQTRWARSIRKNRYLCTCTSQSNPPLCTYLSFNLLNLSPRVLAGISYLTLHDLSVGILSGLKLIVDTETFEYSFIDRGAVGIRMSFSDPRDQVVTRARFTKQN